MKTDSELSLSILKDLVADERVKDLSFAQIKDFLSDKFEQLEKNDLPNNICELRYSLPGRNISIIESNDGLEFLGCAFCKPKQAQSAPCSDPGFAGNLTGIGTGSAGAFVLSFFRILQRKAAVRRAIVDASTNYWALYAALAPSLCPPPCFANSTPLAPRLPVVVPTYSTLLGVPYWVTYNATAWQTEAITCE